MKICFSGFAHSIRILPGCVSVLEIENKVLFSRICQSLLSGKGQSAVEPYSLWSSDNTEIHASEAFLPVLNPFSLPWDNRILVNAIYSRFEGLLLEQDETRGAMEQLNLQLQSNIMPMAFQLNSDYSFGVEWELHRYLKAFGFSVEHNFDAPLIDNLIKFVSYVIDMACEKVLLLVNIKTFLSEIELESLYNQAFFLGSKLLLLENFHDSALYDHEEKLHIDQDLLEN